MFKNIQKRKLLCNIYIYTYIHYLHYLEYCCILWENCSESSKDKLIKFQKRAARVILNKTLEKPCAELFTELQWMTFSERVRFQNALQAYTIMNNICLKFFTKLVYIH